MVGLGLVGVRAGEPAQRPVELVRAARRSRRSSTRRWSGRGPWPAGARRCRRSRPAPPRRCASSGIVPFMFAELPHVVLPAADRGPAEQRVADRLQRLLVLHHPLALVRVPGRLAVHVPGQHRPAGLLELQEHHVVRAAALAAARRRRAARRCRRRRPCARRRPACSRPAPGASAGRGCAGTRRAPRRCSSASRVGRRG